VGPLCVCEVYFPRVLFLCVEGGGGEGSRDPAAARRVRQPLETMAPGRRCTEGSQAWAGLLSCGATRQCQPPARRSHARQAIGSLLAAAGRGDPPRCGDHEQPRSVEAPGNGTHEGVCAARVSCTTAGVLAVRGGSRACTSGQRVPHPAWTHLGAQVRGIWIDLVNLRSEEYAQHSRIPTMTVSPGRPGALLAAGGCRLGREEPPQPAVSHATAVPCGTLGGPWEPAACAA
jgi:hypothetical protein